MKSFTVQTARSLRGFVLNSRGSQYGDSKATSGGLEGDPASKEEQKTVLGFINLEIESTA